ncbi:MAG: hypothetical protein RIK85_17655 [Marinobacter sp.]
MRMVSLPEFDEMRLMTPKRLNVFFSELEDKPLPSGAELDALLFRTGKLFKEVCYKGDIQVVKLLLRGLPRRFTFVSETLVDQGYGIICAAYGGQLDVMDLVLGSTDVQQIFGEDWDFVLQVLADDPIVYERASDPDEPFLSDSIMRALLGLAAYRGCYEFIGVLKKHAETALDKELESQIMHLDSATNN